MRLLRSGGLMHVARSALALIFSLVVLSGSIDAENGGVFKAGSVIGGSGVGVMMFNDDDFALRKAGAEFEQDGAFRTARKRPGDGDALEIVRGYTCDLEGS